MMIDPQLKGKVMVITGANHLENHQIKLSMGLLLSRWNVMKSV